MHMADALLAPAVGGALWAATAATLAWSARQVRREGDDRKVPLMGVLGAFLFAAQMINFAIPGTGSSGHLGGGLLLAILLGPHAAFLVMASVLVVQALFFADGGLLALGCNIFNLGFFPAFVAYPLIYRRWMSPGASSPRLGVTTFVAAVVGLQLGALAVVAQTVASGISALPFGAFAAVMLPIHLAIGLVEGLATVAIVSFIGKSRPDILSSPPQYAASARPLLAGFLALALFTGGLLSLFAAKDPDGLEWSIARVTGVAEAATRATGVHARLASLQQQTAILPHYAFAQPEGLAADARTAGEGELAERLGTSVSGLVGGMLTLVAAALLGCFIRWRARRE
jgi:cobalt/nickel transport system permease protein